MYFLSCLANTEKLGVLGTDCFILKFKVSYTIGFLVKKRFYLYAVELISSNQLKVSIFHVEAIIDHITSGAEFNANRL